MSHPDQEGKPIEAKPVDVVADWMAGRITLVGARERLDWQENQTPRESCKPI